MAEITFKGNPFTTSGELPQVGTSAPDFRLVDENLTDRSLKDFQGKRKILYIVPSLDTSVCSLSTKKFNDVIQRHPQVQLIIASMDSPFAQKRVCSQEKMTNLTTLSILRSKEFAETYGVLIKNGPLEGLCARAILVLDENNQVLYSELVREVTSEPSYETALKVLLKNPHFSYA